MKKKLLLPLLLAGMWATPAMAANTYVSGSVGLGLLNNADASALGVTVDNILEFGTGVPFGVAVGYKSDEYRIEGAVGYQTHGVDKKSGVPVPDAYAADVSIWSFMANGYYDVNMKDSSVSPYLTAGLGLASVSVSMNSYSDDKSVFAWQVGAGVGIKASEHVVVDLGYRYFQTANIAVDNMALIPEHGVGPVDLTRSGSNILAGVRYNF